MPQGCRNQVVTGRRMAASDGFPAFGRPIVALPSAESALTKCSMAGTYSLYTSLTRLTEFWAGVTWNVRKLLRNVPLLQVRPTTLSLKLFLQSSKYWTEELVQDRRDRIKVIGYHFARCVQS